MPLILRHVCAQAMSLAWSSCVQSSLKPGLQYVSVLCPEGPGLSFLTLSPVGMGGPRDGADRPLSTWTRLASPHLRGPVGLPAGQVLQHSPHAGRGPGVSVLGLQHLNFRPKAEWSCMGPGAGGRVVGGEPLWLVAWPVLEAYKSAQQCGQGAVWGGGSCRHLARLLLLLLNPSFVGSLTAPARDEGSLFPALSMLNLPHRGAGSWPPVCPGPCCRPQRDELGEGAWTLLAVGLACLPLALVSGPGGGEPRCLVGTGDYSPVKAFTGSAPSAVLTTDCFRLLPGLNSAGRGLSLERSKDG